MPTVGVFAVLRNDEGHVLLVKQNYGNREWTLPGGRMEDGESFFETFAREITEETNLRALPVRFAGAYSTPFNNDMVILIEGAAPGQIPNADGTEISEVAFFAPSSLPEEMSPRMRFRIEDSLRGAPATATVFKDERAIDVIQLTSARGTV